MLCKLVGSPIHYSAIRPNAFALSLLAAFYVLLRVNLRCGSLNHDEKLWRAEVMRPQTVSVISVFL